MSPDRRNRSAWLWLGILLCTIAGAFFGAVIGAPNDLGIVGTPIGFVVGFLVGVYGARKSVGR